MFIYNWIMKIVRKIYVWDLTKKFIKSQWLNDSAHQEVSVSNIIKEIKYIIFVFFLVLCLGFFVILALRSDFPIFFHLGIATIIAMLAVICWLLANLIVQPKKSISICRYGWMRVARLWSKDVKEEDKKSLRKLWFWVFCSFFSFGFVGGFLLIDCYLFSPPEWHDLIFSFPLSLLAAFLVATAITIIKDVGDIEVIKNIEFAKRSLKYGHPISLCFWICYGVYKAIAWTMKKFFFLMGKFFIWIILTDYSILVFVVLGVLYAFLSIKTGLDKPRDSFDLVLAYLSYSSLFMLLQISLGALVKRLKK